MKMKNRVFKKFVCLAVCMVLSILCLSLAFIIPPVTQITLGESTQNTHFATTDSSTLSIDYTILNYISISQENHVFTQSDFTTVTMEDTDYPAIFSNNTISMRNVSAKTFRVNSINDNTSVSLYEKTINGQKYYVFNIDEITEDAYYIISMECTQDIQTSRGTVQQTYHLTFCIVQTTTNFKKASSQYGAENAINWHYTTGSKDFDVSAPEMNQTYSTITLSFPAGSFLNPVFVNFIYLGESYTLVRYKDTSNHIITYNQANNVTIDDVTDLSEAMKLTLDKSGAYTVKIYDKTSTVASNVNNMLEYHFNIKNQADPFYISVVNAVNGSMIMNGQIINTNALVNFVNFSEIRSTTSKVEVNRSYRPTDNQNTTDTTSYPASTLPENITIDKDGVYEIIVYDRQLTPIKTYGFTILQSIRSSFTIEGETISTEVSDPVNTPISRTMTSNISSSYRTLQTSTEYSFVVTVAKSSPSITGINNNSGTSNSVNLTVHGVGNIDVYASLDGKSLDLSNYTFENGSTLPTFSERGNYYVRITDEMGTIATKSFAITIQLNTASIILISIAAAAILFILIFVIVSRMRIKVR